MGPVEVLLLVTGIAMIVVTQLPFLPADVWWIRGWEFPRVQIATITLVVLLLLLIRQPDFGFWGLLFVNVEMINRRAERLKEIIHGAEPDIILAVGTDQWWQTQLHDFAKTHPHTCWHPQDNYYGMMLFSRLELIDPQIKFLVQDDIPSIHARIRLRDGRMVQLHCLHPRPPVPNDGNERSTERDAELLLLGRQLKDVDEPMVVLGDLNDVAWSHTSGLFARISGLLDPRVGRGFYNSFHARIFLLRFPLDHLYHSNHFRLVDFERLPAFGSDHFPMFVVLNLEPEAKAEQNAEPASPEDEAEASEKIQKVA